MMPISIFSSDTCYKTSTLELSFATSDSKKRIGDSLAISSPEHEVGRRRNATEHDERRGSSAFDIRWSHGLDHWLVGREDIRCSNLPRHEAVGRWWYFSERWWKAERIATMHSFYPTKHLTWIFLREQERFEKHLQLTALMTMMLAR